MLENILHAIFEKSTSGIDKVAFSISIKATIFTKDQQLSTSCKSVME